MSKKKNKVDKRFSFPDDPELEAFVNGVDTGYGLSDGDVDDDWFEDDDDDMWKKIEEEDRERDAFLEEQNKEWDRHMDEEWWENR